MTSTRLREQRLQQGGGFDAQPGAMERAYPNSGGNQGYGDIQQQAYNMSSQMQIAEQTALDLDVTVLAFAQWVSELKARQSNSQHQMTAEMSIIRNAITTNNQDLSDFKRHSAQIQQQMTSEISEIREALSKVFAEITEAVRNNASADQAIKSSIQNLNEQAVRNETSFAQLADAADQSQSKLRNAVQEMQGSSERMRDELVALNRYVENLENTVGERTEGISLTIDQLGQDQHLQLEHRKEHLKKMTNDVVLIGESLGNMAGDFSEHKNVTGQVQNKLQSTLYVLDQTQRPAPASPQPQAQQAALMTRAAYMAGSVVGGLPATSESLQQVRHVTPLRVQSPSSIITTSQPHALVAGSMAARPMQSTSMVYR